mgnify:CR=1 FL=1
MARMLQTARRSDKGMFSGVRGRSKRDVDPPMQFFTLNPMVFFLAAESSRLASYGRFEFWGELLDGYMDGFSNRHFKRRWSRGSNADQKLFGRRFDFFCCENFLSSFAHCENFFICLLSLLTSVELKKQRKNILMSCGSRTVDQKISERHHYLYTNGA